ncbi:MAG TPA: ABC transporter ATP-binding protein [Candidatus Sulfotelmatobacter sp.]|jgi:ABC-2 type transport system ATP-binding protein|nr:ABC transporter ATP-binding protein [Candidatus Sulfotelmatobacter sp.]
MNAECLAELSEVSKRFGKLLALDGLNLEVRPAELLAVLGPNGAGKSTAISLLLGLRQADSGTARLFGQSPQDIASRRQVGVMMQEVALAPELRVREQIDLVASYYPDALTAAAMRITRTLSLAGRPYGKLSNGQKRQVQFAMAVVGRPKLLFLDEPTVGLDLPSREMMWAMLRELIREGSSIVLTTHYLEEAEALADRVVVLAKGRTIASGTVNELRSLVGRKRISCATSLTVELVAAWPEVQTVSRDRGRLHITASNADTVVKRLAIADGNFQDLEVHNAGLAEAFTELTQTDLTQTDMTQSDLTQEVAS